MELFWVSILLVESLLTIWLLIEIKITTGWYRDCGIIPHTTDMDFSMKSEDFEKKIKKFFLGNQDMGLWLRLGYLNENYELRLKPKQLDKFIFDLFLTYDYNSTHQNNGYHYKQYKLKYTCISKYS